VRLNVSLAIRAMCVLALAAVPVQAASVAEGSSQRDSRGAVGLPAWDVVATPDVPGGSLRGVHIAAPGDVWAVGTSAGRTLVERWDGTAFAIVKSPNRRGRSNVLEDVDGVAPNDVWAVGHADVTDLVGSRTLIEHWNGSRWAIIPSPSMGSTHDANELTGVAALATNDVWAVGTFINYDDGETFRPLVLHWNGSRWRFAKNGCVRELSDLDARAPNDIWAVGGGHACHFDGSAWRSLPAGSPPNPQASVILQDVKAVSANEAWAVGEEFIECGESVCYSGELQRWDGSSWEHVRNDTPIGYGIDGAGPKDLYAVGLAHGPAVIHFDGSSWVDVPEGADIGQLLAVVTSAHDVWAVGETPGNPPMPLVEHAPSPDSGAVVGGTNVSGATVSWFGKENGSVETDQYGGYQVGGLAAGTYTFTATYAGCQPDSARVRVKAGEIIGRDFHLEC
jgi:hypothetical protein